VGVGIGTGPAFVGNIQSSDRFIWTVIGNTANRNGGTGLAIGGGSVVAHNAADGNAVGLSIGCPSNVIGNTAINNSSNLLQQGAGCSLVDNVAP
jgi:hypothetical protein